MWAELKLLFLTSCSYVSIINSNIFSLSLFLGFNKILGPVAGVNGMADNNFG